jgi:hypothetical protein
MIRVLAVLAIVMAMASTSFGGWSGAVADRNVSYFSDDTKLAWYSRVAIGPEGNLYLIWRQGQTLQPYEVYYGRSTDNGATWSSETADRQINASDGQSVSNVGDRPLDIDMDNQGNIFVIWSEDLDTTAEIMLLKSTDQGGTWIHSDTDFPISHTGEPLVNANNPSMAVDYDNNIFVVWHQVSTDGTGEIHISKSSDGGDTWSGSAGNRYISFADGYNAQNPDIIIDRNNNIYVVWDERETDDIASAMIHYGKSTDGGATFNSETADYPISTAIRSSGNPYIVADLQNNIYVTWRATNATVSPFYYEAFYSHTTDGGATWSGLAGQIRVDYGVSDSSSVNYPAIAVTSEGNLCVVWNESRFEYADGQIFASYSYDSGTTWTGGTSLDLVSHPEANGHPAYRPDIFCSFGDTLHVFWNEGVDSDGYYDIHYSKGDTLGSAPPGPGLLAGYVYEGDGTTPIADVRVETYDSLFALIEVDTTGSLGEYEVILYPGIYSQSLIKDGYETANLDSIEITSDDTTVVSVIMVVASGCQYIPGDINGNGFTNGIDVTFGVAFFKGGNIPPIDCGTPEGPCPQASPFYAAGDVNGNCAFNGIDITFFVSYLKGGQPEILFCETCPPAD